MSGRAVSHGDAITIQQVCHPLLPGCSPIVPLKYTHTKFSQVTNLHCTKIYPCELQECVPWAVVWSLVAERHWPAAGCGAAYAAAALTGFAQAAAAPPHSDLQRTTTAEPAAAGEEQCSAPSHKHPRLLLCIRVTNVILNLNVVNLYHNDKQKNWSYQSSRFKRRSFSNTHERRTEIFQHTFCGWFQQVLLVVGWWAKPAD